MNAGDRARGRPRASARVAVRLRDAVDSDVEAMGAIEQQAFSDPWPVSAFRDLIGHAHTRLTVALDPSDAVVGYCVMLHVLDEGEIANIAVAPAHRGRGIAAQLLDDALTTARGAGARAIFLEVRLSNDPARRLYESRGFLPVGRRRAYYRDPVEDALVLRWECPAA